jgi:hypothetical protein
MSEEFAVRKDHLHGHLVVSILAVFVVITISQAARADGIGHIYVLNAKSKSVEEFAGVRGGNISPALVIVGPLTRISDPVEMAVDPRGTIFVLNRHPASVVEFAPGASGNAAPLMVLTGPHTGLSDPVGMALGYNDAVFVADKISGIEIFPGGAHGDASPTTIYGRDYGVESDITGIGVDLLGQVFYSSLDGNSVTTIQGVAPGHGMLSYKLSGPHSHIVGPTALSVDGFGRLYVSNRDDSVLFFGSGARGDAAPTVDIRGSRTLLSNPGISGFDAGSCIFTPSSADDAVLEFDPGTTGNTRPIMVIRGNRTLLDDPVSVSYW